MVSKLLQLAAHAAAHLLAELEHFSARGSYTTPSASVDGFAPALAIGAITVTIGAAAALLIPPLHRATAATRKRALEAAA